MKTSLLFTIQAFKVYSVQLEERKGRSNYNPLEVLRSLKCPVFSNKWIFGCRSVGKPPILVTLFWLSAFIADMISFMVEETVPMDVMAN